MEILTKLPVTERIGLRSLLSFESVEEMWSYASQHVTTRRQDELSRIWASITGVVDGFTEHHFMREMMWVVHVSGFSARVVGKKFSELLRAHNVEDSNQAYIPITKGNIIPKEQFAERIYPVWKNEKKAVAIQKTRTIILDEGWDRVYQHIRPAIVDPKVLEMFPYIGSTLACHLARNLGNIRVVKPDKHLMRLADKFGFASPRDLCLRCTNDHPEGWVDLVLWIASTDCGTL